MKIGDLVVPCLKELYQRYDSSTTELFRNVTAHPTHALPWKIIRVQSYERLLYTVDLGDGLILRFKPDELALYNADQTKLE